MDFTFTKEQLKEQKKAQKFAENVIAPLVEKIENDLSLRYGLFQKMAKEGFFLLSFASNTGMKADTIAYALSLIEIAKVDAGVAVAMAVTNMVAETIDRFGSSQQKEKFLSKMSFGECIPAAFALTEKMAGSDAKSIQLEAHLDPSNPNFYVLNGEKQFITNGDIAEELIVMVKTDHVKDGISAFIVEHERSGLTVSKKERKLGLLTANLVDLRFTNCQIPKENLLGKLGEGLHIALGALDSGRISIAAQALGIATAAYMAALKYASERSQFGKTLSAHQAIAFKLADMEVKLAAARLLLYRACLAKDSGSPFTLEAATAKLFCSESCNEIVTEALQIHGGYGYTKDYPLEKYFRDARATTIYEGTSEIQRIVIARNILQEQVNFQEGQDAR